MCEILCCLYVSMSYGQMHVSCAMHDNWDVYCNSVHLYTCMFVCIMLYIIESSRDERDVQ